MKPTERFRFGKHKGKYLKDVLNNDPGYVEWCKNNIPGFVIDEPQPKKTRTRKLTNIQQEIADSLKDQCRSHYVKNLKMFGFLKKDNVRIICYTCCLNHLCNGSSKD